MHTLRLRIRRRFARRPRATVRPGISLVEVLVALTLLAVVLTSLAGLTVTAGRGAVRVAGGGYREGMLTQEINRLSATPFAALPAAAGCQTVASGPFPHTRCVTVASVNTRLRRVTIIVTPTQPGVTPDTVVFDRSDPPTFNPLSTP